MYSQKRLKAKTRVLCLCLFLLIKTQCHELVGKCSYCQFRMFLYSKKKYIQINSGVKELFTGFSRCCALGYYIFLIFLVRTQLNCFFLTLKFAGFPFLDLFYSGNVSSSVITTPSVCRLSSEECGGYYTTCALSLVNFLSQLNVSAQFVN